MGKVSGGAPGQAFFIGVEEDLSLASSSLKWLWDRTEVMVTLEHP